MGKAKKHGKSSKGSTKKNPKNPKNDTRKRKVKYVDPTSSVSRDVRDSLAAIAQQIERGDSDGQNSQLNEGEKDAPQLVSKKMKKNEKRRKEIAETEGINLKRGMTIKQAYKMASKAHQPRPIANIPDPDYEEEEDADDGDGNPSEDMDYSDTANERAAEYRRGGYHPVVVGDVYNDRYRVVKKLGWGYFSTVWLCWDYNEERYQAMKIQKSAQQYREAAFDEIKLLSQIMQADPHRTRHCTRLNDYFEHTGSNGTHVCMVFDVYGENLLSLIERYEYRGVPLPIVKCISRQILVALEHIASIDIIHTDLKPENTLLSTPKHSIISLMRRYHPPPQHQRPRLTERDPKTMTKSQRRRYYKKLAKEREALINGHAPSDDSDDYDSASDKDNGRKSASEASKTDSEWEVERFHHVILADFGNSCWTYKRFTDEVQTRQYRCPEVILGEPYSTPIDIWSCACMIFELITGEFLFDPKKGDDYTRDEDHLALMSELLGDLPESMRLGDGKFRSQYYNSRGELRNIRELHFWGLEDVLHQRHRFTREKAKEIADFLLPMLEFDPERRATATEMLRDYDTFFEIKEDDYEPLCFKEAGNEDEEEDEEDDLDEEDEEDDLDEEDEEGEDAYEDSYSSDSRRRDDGADEEDEEEVKDEEKEVDDIDNNDDDAEPLDVPLNRSRRAITSDDERAEAFRYWEEHPILNRSSLEHRGLTIADIQSVLGGKMLDTPAAQEAANEVICLLSEETERLSTGVASDGHDADQEDEGELDDGADETFFDSAHNEDIEHEHEEVECAADGDKEEEGDEEGEEEGEEEEKPKA